MDPYSSKDNSITIISPTSELGQGTHTAHAMIIAEELGRRLEDRSKLLRPLLVLNTRKIYTCSLLLLMMESLAGGTGLRKLVQGLERFLLRQAHKKWEFPKTECEVQDGHVSSS